MSKCAKLDFKMNYMVVRQSDATTKIYLHEVYMVIFETTEITITACLLAEFVKHKIAVVFCDEKRNPTSQLLPLYGSHDTSAKVRKQIEWSADSKQWVWTEIIGEKIRKQRDFLKELGLQEESLLTSYLEQLQLNDASNREGHAAKVYFNALFGMDFTRTSEYPVNAALNYGYTLLLSAFNREIVAAGYLTQFGLFHDNMFNPYNLASDLMEPFRILIDRIVYEMRPEKFEHEEKMVLVNVFNQEVLVEGRHVTVASAIKSYCKSIFEALNEKDVSLIRFYRNDL